MLLSPNTSESWECNLLKLVWPYLLVAGILLVVFIALLLLGLDLGYFDDTLYYQYLYEKLGIREANTWLFSLGDQRHPLSRIWLIFIFKVLGGSSVAWFGSTLFVHFANGFLSFLLLDSLLRQRYRVVSFAVALLFVFNTRQLGSDFSIAMQGFIRLGFSFALLSLWFFLQYVRTKRRNIWWRDLSLLFYVFGFVMYETNALFFLLHPIMAYYEDQYQDTICTRRAWVHQQIADSFWFPTIFLIYWVILSLLMTPASTAFSPSLLLRTMLVALQSEFSLGQYIQQLALVLQGGWAVLTMSAFLLIFALIWILQRLSPDAALQPNTSPPPKLNSLAVFGVGLFVVNVILVAPTGWDPLSNPRIMYPATLGVAVVISVGLFWVLSFLPAPLLHRIGFSTVIAAFIAVGFASLFQLRHEYARQHDARQAVLDAVKAVAPSWKGDVPPYILLTSDAHPSSELWLHSQDANFPLMFNLLYDTEGIQADAVYFDTSATSAPKPDEPSNLYHGPYILMDDEGIYSPLRPVLPRPYVPAPLNSIIVIYYDNETQTATILDEIPPDVLEHGNIVVRTSEALKTNFDLIGR